MKHWHQGMLLIVIMVSNTIICSPGKYEHDIKLSKRIDYEYSFGGRRMLKETVRIKCTNGIPEKVSKHYYNGFIIMLMYIVPIV